MIKAWLNPNLSENENDTDIRERQSNSNYITILTFNLRNLACLKGRTNFANRLLAENVFLCLSETWLTNDIPNEELFFIDSAIYQND